MTRAIDYDARRGVLVAEAPVLDAIVGGTPDAALRRRLHRSGVLDGDRIQPDLERAIDALRRPVGGTLAVCYRGRSLHAWLGARAVAVRPPQQRHGRDCLLRLAPSLLPAAVIRAVALGPRPPAQGMRSTEEMLSDPTVVRWWRLLRGGPGADEGTLLEVIDTHGGLRVVDAEGATYPASGSEILRLIVRSCLGHRHGLRPLGCGDGGDLPRAWC